MEEKKGKICRLCLEYIPEENFVNGVRTEMLKVLLVELNLLVSDEPVTCSTCDGNLQKCFNFKMTCLTTEDCIKTFANSPDTHKVNLQHVLLKEFADNSIDGEKREICRLCFNLDSEVFTKLDTGLMNMLKRCIPEVNINLTNDPVICSFCSALLKQVFDFVQACSKIEERLMQFYVTGTECAEDDNKIDLAIVKVETSTDGFQAQMEELGNYNYAISDFVKQEEKFEEVEMKCELEEVKCEVDRADPLLDPVLLLSTQPQSRAYSCKKCDFQTQDNQEIKVHYLTHDMPGRQLYQCPNCSFMTKYHQSFNRHIMLIHKDQVEINWYKCNICTYQSKFKSALKVHILRHDQNAEQFKCEHCPYKTVQKYLLRSHMMIHKPPMFKCNCCKYSTRYRRNLTLHILSHTNQDDIKQYKCDICTYRTKFKGKLKLHMLKCDLNSEQIKCEHCPYKTVQKFRLKQHMKIHKPPMFKCNCCKFSTRYRSSLTLHNLIHKNQDDIEWYKCDICTYQTKFKRNLKVHMLKHAEDFKCKLCSYKTARTYHLKQHMIIHKPKCSMQLLLLSKSNLNIRKLKHETGDAKVLKCA